MTRGRDEINTHTRTPTESHKIDVGKIPQVSKGSRVPVDGRAREDFVEEATFEVNFDG